uniref:HTH_48 domain-containing protein n=1 Tax=Heterorhabditis bacteriophora TaxID=37862 RepID=A0A1I7W9V8_HETBA
MSRAICTVIICLLEQGEENDVIAKKLCEFGTVEHRSTSGRPRSVNTTQMWKVHKRILPGKQTYEEDGSF